MFRASGTEFAMKPRAAACLLLAACGKESGKPAPATTPDELFARVKPGAEKGDFVPLFEAFDPQGRLDVLVSAYQAARYSTESKVEVGREKLEDILRKQGIENFDQEHGKSPDGSLRSCIPFREPSRTNGNAPRSRTWKSRETKAPGPMCWTAAI